jgi:hypothetical protein
MKVGAKREITARFTPTKMAARLYTGPLHDFDKSIP